MRHEIIRMEHVNISRPGRHEIEDLNQIICRGTAWELQAWKTARRYWQTF